jgi:bifunctional UDP-N-acetylglucosamine pyrophosphorylase/glucosamine-1-phosphate N-acetyltransferase
VKSNSNQPTVSPVVAGIVLAAGKGTRMRSARPKVLHTVLGRPMVGWVLDSLAKAGIKQSVMVISSDQAPFEDFLQQYPDLALAVQRRQKGTADAVASAYGLFADGSSGISYVEGSILRGSFLDATHVLICAGDTPALDGEELARFIRSHATSDVAILGMEPEDPNGYGRLVIVDGALTGIIEEKDADPDTKKIRLVNSGVVLARRDILFKLLAQVTPNNAQGEYYLTDVVKLAHQQSYVTTAYVAREARQFAGVNDRQQLASIEEWMLARRQTEIMANGITLHLPKTIYLEAEVEIGEDSVIGPGSRFFGRTKIGRGCFIGAGVTLRDANIEDGAVIADGAVIVSSNIGVGASVPALAYIQKGL